MSLRELMHWNRPFSIPVQRRNYWDQALEGLQEEMNGLFDDFFHQNGFRNTPMQISAGFPAIDIIEEEKDIKIKAEVAGYTPEEIEVSVNDGFLTFSGKRKEEEEEKEENYLRRELSFGSFQRTIALPETANSENAEATFKNGILSIEIPKKEEAIKKMKKLEIKKSA